MTKCIIICLACLSPIAFTLYYGWYVQIAWEMLAVKYFSAPALSFAQSAALVFLLYMKKFMWWEAIGSLDKAYEDWQHVLSVLLRPFIMLAIIWILTTWIL